MINGKNNGASADAPNYDCGVNFQFSDHIRVRIGQACACFRKEYGWTQEQVASAIDTNQITLSKFENGQLIKPEKFYWYYIQKMLEMNDLSYLEEVLNVEKNEATIGDTDQ